MSKAKPANLNSKLKHLAVKLRTQVNCFLYFAGSTLASSGNPRGLREKRGPDST